LLTPRTDQASSKRIGVPQVALGDLLRRRVSVAETKAYRILLVVDEPAVARRLTERGYQVEVVRDGAQALLAHDAYRYDVAILGHHALDDDVWTTVRMLRARTPDLPCLLIVSAGGVPDVKLGMEAGICDCLVQDADHVYLEWLPCLVERALMRLQAEREHASVEAALQESRRALTTLMDNLPGMAYRCLNDADWRLLFVSSGCEALTGYPQHDLLLNRRLSYAELVHHEDRARLRRAIAEGLRDGRHFECEYRIVTASGEVRWVWERGTQVPGNDGAEVLEGFIFDVTARREAERQLRDYSERLEERVAERTRALEEAQSQLVRREKLAVMGQIAGGVGHELRTPLSIIKNAAFLLAEAINDASLNAGELVAMIDGEVERADRIVADLLDFARSGTPVPLPLEPEALITGALARAQLPGGIEVVTDVPAALPLVLADPLQMEQVLLNLITNAHQSMGSIGTLTLRAAASDAGHLVFVVSDTGGGISESVMTQLFEPLFSTKARGIGLGLALCKHHVEANGGTIAAANNPERGATFTVTLPILAPTEG
jgi:PAS domain S-box-containing protein